MLYERLIGLQTPPDREEKKENFGGKTPLYRFIPDATYVMSLEPA